MQRLTTPAQHQTRITPNSKYSHESDVLGNIHSIEDERDATAICRQTARLMPTIRGKWYALVRMML